MKKLEFNTTLLDQYINILSKLSSKARQYLIEKLEGTLDNKPPKKGDNLSLYGAWGSNESAKDLIELISNSRTFERKIEEF